MLATNTLDFLKLFFTKNFEFILINENNSFALNFLLMLLLTKYGPIFSKTSGKWNLIETNNFYNSEMVFASQIKIITFNIWLTVIYI